MSRRRVDTPEMESEAIPTPVSPTPPKLRGDASILLRIRGKTVRLFNQFRNGCLLNGSLAPPRSRAISMGTVVRGDGVVMFDWLTSLEFVEGVIGLLLLVGFVRFLHKLAKRRQFARLERDQRLRTLGS